MRGSEIANQRFSDRTTTIGATVHISTCENLIDLKAAIPV